MNSIDILNKLVVKVDLKTVETKFLLTEIMQGNVPALQIAAILTALRMKGETVDEIIGFVQAMREKMISVKAKNAIDLCGTGGDGSKSFNISTAAAFVVASAGVKVAKHGNRAASSTCGSADVLEALGVNINLSATQTENVLEKVGMVFLFAPNFHPATKQVALVRKELKIRTIFNFLGPFLSPASVTRQVIGVPNLEIAEKLIKVGKKLGYKHLLILTSSDGMDEVSIFAKTHVMELKNNNITRFVIDPQQFGFKKASKKAIAEGSLEQNAQYIRDILDGVKNSRRDIVVLNAAVALYASDVVQDIKEGLNFAEQAIDSGRAKALLKNLIKETNHYA